MIFFRKNQNRKKMQNFPEIIPDLFLFHGIFFRADNGKKTPEKPAHSMT